jgi:DnaJ-class molecular chaperone
LYCISITIAEALSGWKRTITTQTGTKLKMCTTGPTKPILYFDVKFSRGRNSSDEPGGAYIHVRIVYPELITAQQQKGLENVLRQTDAELGNIQVKAVNADEGSIRHMKVRTHVRKK